MAAHRGVRQKWRTVIPDSNLTQTVGFSLSSVRSRTCAPVSIRGDQPSPPKSPSPFPRQRVLQGPPGHILGECARSESETAVGLGMLRPPHCRQQGWGQPAELSLPSCRQILPAHWPDCSTANTRDHHPPRKWLGLTTAWGLDPAGKLPKEGPSKKPNCGLS